MSNVRELIDAWSAKVLARAEQIQHIGASYKLVVEGANGGTWRLNCRAPVTIEEGEGPADCSVAVSSSDFVSILEKRLNPQLAYLTGKLKVSGNIGLALKLAEIF